MSYRVLPAADQHWRPSNVMGVANTDLTEQLGASVLGARLWRLEPGQASTWHRHEVTEELYVLVEGTGRARVGDETLTVEPGTAMLVDPDTLRQLFNDTDADQLWLVVGAPPEMASTLEMTEEDIARRYPDGLQAMPPELGGG
ncbi:MAG TPA: cupin domain-containing protein [Thermoleophilaceae bacterium]|nr:cupin domain-containing protein [Thermoleophilaceae bacterium]